MTGADEALKTGQTIGIIGGGQLGRMLAEAAAHLRLKTHIYTPEANAPAASVASAMTQGAYDDIPRLTAFAAAIDRITYEFENIPAAALAALQATRPVFPPAKALAVSQDRLDEKTFIREQGFKVADFRDINTPQNLLQGLADFGEGILKTRRFGYDGKGQWRLCSDSTLDAVLAELKNNAAILEKLVDFEREISVLVARNARGDIAVYDPIENQHENQILVTSRVPARITPAQQDEAVNIAKTLAVALDYVGVLAVEIFVTKDGLVVNEIAPRVHNSGHLTADACECGQFEQHIRAVAGWPLGDTRRHSDAVMTNLLGVEPEEIRKMEKQLRPQERLTNYHKTEARRGRKMGHITRLSEKSDV